MDREYDLEELLREFSSLNEEPERPAAPAPKAPDPALPAAPAPEAEEAPAEYRAAFDFAASRAVARLNLLCELCLPRVIKGGAFIAMKGPDCQAELDEAKKAIQTLGGKLERRVDYTIPGTDITHSAVIIRKVADTPAKYPRRWGQIKKTPL